MHFLASEAVAARLRNLDAEWENGWDRYTWVAAPKELLEEAAALLEPKFTDSATFFRELRAALATSTTPPDQDQFPSAPETR
jgi:hypothetical protein